MRLLAFAWVLTVILFPINSFSEDNSQRLSMKGLEVWSWLSTDGRRVYSLPAGTNRTKSCNEIFSGIIGSLKELESNLRNLPVGENLILMTEKHPILAGARCEPRLSCPEVLEIKRIQEISEELGLKFRVYGCPESAPSHK